MSRVDSYTKLFEDLSEPSGIWYAKAPPSLGGVPRHITIAEFTEKLAQPGFMFSENFYATSPDLSIDDPEQYYAKSEIVKLAESALDAPDTYYDKLVVCNMGKFGHGVFARKSINPGDIICFYSGVINSADMDTDSYSMGLVAKDNTSAPLAVYAGQRGGIARFIQHLPSNKADLADHLINYFQYHPEAIEDYFLKRRAGYLLNPSERTQELAYLKKDFAKHSGRSFKDWLTRKAKLDYAEWEIDALETTGPVSSNIAYENVKYQTILIKGKPVEIIRALRFISPGEQLGFSYGIGYWIYKTGDNLPALFTEEGAELDRSKYRFRSSPLFIPTSGGPQIYCSPLNGEPNIEKQRLSLTGDERYPVVSFFQSRRNSAIPYDSSLVRKLKKIFPDQFEFQLVWSNPSVEDEKRQYAVNLYCKAKNLEFYELFMEKLQLLSNSPKKDLIPHSGSGLEEEDPFDLEKKKNIVICTSTLRKENLIIYYDSTLEIVIQDINFRPNVDFMHELLLTLSKGYPAPNTSSLHSFSP